MDELLRELERQAAHGEPGARARLLRERVRSGALARGSLRLASHLGDLDARAAVDGEAPFAPTLDAWVLGLEPFGKEAALRVGVAAGYLALPVWEVALPEDPRLEHLLASVDRWILDPGERAQEDVIRCAGALRVEADWFEDALGWIEDSPPEDLLREGGLALAEAVGLGAGFACIRVRNALDDFSEATSVPALQSAVRREVLPWALGEGDLVLERVARGG